jgi:hypothetical protein
LDDVRKKLPGEITRERFSNDNSKNLGVLARRRKRVATISIALIGCQKDFAGGERHEDMVEERVAVRLESGWRSG